MNYVINLFWDKEAFAWIAICDDISLVLESDSVEILIERVKLTIPELLCLNKAALNKSITLSFIIKCEL
jgi:hypothetical protein